MAKIKNEKQRKVLVLRKARWYLARYVSYHGLSQHKKQLTLRIRSKRSPIEKYSRTCFIYFAGVRKWVGLMIFDLDAKFKGISIPENVKARIKEEVEKSRFKDHAPA